MFLEFILFEELFFIFIVMESDFVVYMIGVIFVEFFGIFFWFDIMGGNYDSYFDVDKGIGIIIVVKFFDVE